ncbi:MAG: imidazole glycerol phosphate synthase subunit HisH [Nitrospira sp.]|nr:imidazole glycerol phosphate synthase subunit HisH [Nitrospira sp.]MCP9463388.1 imidazole glycerol phosphate synthase subunit HisH [Nitrospira sp.]
MTSSVLVVDYGMGNLYSIGRALEHLGASVQISDTAESIEEADRLVLPGVGAFADGMRELERRGLIKPLKKYIASGRPLLGICLGMQLLFEASEEFGEHRGLGLLPGRVVAVPETDVDGKPHKIPHMGWSALRRPVNRHSWAGTILANVEEGESVYFVHSFMAVPADKSNRLADAYYGGQQICAAVQWGQIYGCQFHPEKSGKVGLGILTSFLQIE